MKIIENLTSKIKMEKTKLIKSMASLTMAGIAGISAATFVGCKSDSTEPIENQNQTQQEQQSQNQEQQTSEQQKKYSKYSKTLQNVLLSDYYNGIISRRLSGTDVASRNNLECIPYGFLEDEDYNIAKIKSGELYCYSDCYIDGNDLYIECKVEKESSTNFLGNYLIKYTLTDQEKDELDKLHKSLSVNLLRTYFQAPFFIQELSYTHTPTVVSEAYSTKDTIQALKTSVSKKPSLKIHTPEITYAYKYNVYTEDDFQLVFYAHNKINSDRVKTEAKITLVRKYGTRDASLINIDSYEVVDYNATGNNVNVEQEAKTFKFYNSHDAIFANILENDNLSILN